MKRYATAIGILVGGAIGGVLSIALRAPLLIGVFSLGGLIIGHVISQHSTLDTSFDDDADPQQRLQRLDELRAKSLINEKEYETKRQEIISHL